MFTGPRKQIFMEIYVRSFTVFCSVVVVYPIRLLKEIKIIIGRSFSKSSWKRQ